MLMMTRHTFRHINRFVRCCYSVVPSFKTVMRCALLPTLHQTALRHAVCALLCCAALVASPAAWALSLSPATPGAAAKPATAFAIAGLTDCASISQVYDIDKEACAPATLSTATDVMGPLISASGEIIDPDTIEASMNESATGEQKDAKKSDGSGDNAACSNGVYTDGCEDGAKRLCALIPGGSIAPVEYHEAAAWALLAIGLIVTSRRRLQLQ